MKQAIAAAVVGALVLSAVPAVGEETTLDQRNHEWAEDALGLEADEDHPILLKTPDGFEETTAAWIVDHVADRLTRRGLDATQPAAGDGPTDPVTDDFPASGFMLLTERVKFRSTSPDTGCNQGGGGVGGHYDHAAPSPATAWRFSTTQAQANPPVGPSAGVQVSTDTAVLPYLGSATSSFSKPGHGNVWLWGPSAEAQIDGQGVGYDQFFDYDDATVTYAGSSDFFCLTFFNAWTGTTTLFNAPFVNGHVEEVAP